MFTKTDRRRSVLFTVLLVGILTVVVLPIQASASQMSFQDTANVSSCFTCHEDLYYLHDMGKSYCITVHKDHCTNCHSGDPSVMDKDLSHLRLIVYPQKDNGAKCLECHTQDAQERLVTFASMAGYKPVVEVTPYIPVNTITVEFPDMDEPTPVIESLPWIVGAFIAFGLWLGLVFWSQKP